MRFLVGEGKTGMVWIQAFCFTQLIEVPIYWPYLRGSGSEPRAPLRRLGMAFSLSLVTHPFVWFLFPRLLPGDFLPMLAAAEGFAIGVEALMLRAFGTPRPLGVSLLANGCSAGAGFVIYALEKGSLAW